MSVSEADIVRMREFEDECHAKIMQTLVEVVKEHCELLRATPGVDPATVSDGVVILHYAVDLMSNCILTCAVEGKEMAATAEQVAKIVERVLVNKDTASEYKKAHPEDFQEKR